MKKQRILAIDDEPHMLKLLERIISEKTPYEVVSTNSSLEAVDMLDKEEFDLIITDLKMPGMDGMDILKMIKEKKRREEVIMITAFGSLESAIEALSMGVFDYITKPFKKEQIIYTVDRAMKWQRMKDDSMRFREILSALPFESAVMELKKRYVEHYADKLGNSPDMIAEQTGISVDEVRKIVENAKK